MSFTLNFEESEDFFLGNSIDFEDRQFTYVYSPIASGTLSLSKPIVHYLLAIEKWIKCLYAHRQTPRQRDKSGWSNLLRTDAHLPLLL